MSSVREPAARTVAGLVLVGVGFGLTGCAKNPVTGARELMLMTHGQEVALGRDADRSIVAQYGMVDDPALTSYVDQIGQQLVGVSHRTDMTFTFRVLDDPVVNAFALPGGYVYLTRGILAYLNSEAGMAGVLGHEVGHVTARHGAQRYTQQQLLGLGLGVSSVISEDVAKVAGVAAGAAGLLFLKFGRDDERQSDQLGVEYATRIGYDTRDMANFFKTLDELSGDERLPAWQSTHPDPGERYETVTALTAQWKAQVPGTEFKWRRDEFLQMLDEMAFGPNPRHGYVEDDLFKHPDLAFSFPIPTGWRVANGRSQVQVGEPNGEAALVLTLADEASPRAAADAFVSDPGITEASREDLRVQGLPAVRVKSSAAAQSGALSLESTFVALDGRVFTLHGLSPEASRGRHASTMRYSMNRFQRLTDRESLDVKPVRIDVVSTPRAMTLGELLAEYPIPARADANAEDVALMNRINVNERVPKGTLVKVLK